ncbi:carbamoyl-phosphate synthase (glutamine-hydrolyzing) large subunit [Stygiobacter electus]|uniref:Carbamoyl-phosphate synthase (Glutamine-hydrolyzing) large subunit n=1 Tax=Stygiobacter electus TaxID=3032292 RepID=A0AAE3TBC6_9BACT|nr:carbamoyl-phosphate synthase (glutamine-hydrolyzing) large subunit [Stygiobacter electus]MDF1611158.1 carbamoyl-phosphate synthase (glutamine-hydrolyzing) large subunit [Stygiobacter electus]
MKIKKILIIGSSALKIGEAGEFDYSGSQAIKAFKEEGIYTILINPNIATNQTSDHLADKVYLLPINTNYVEKVIAKEKPDGIVLGFGGQTALNCGLDLHRKGILKKYKVEVLGTQIDAIENTEDRQLFCNKLDEIKVKYPKSKAVNTVEDAIAFAEEIKFPVIIRIAYALGGLGSGVCRNKNEVKKLATKALNYSSQILVEEYLEGWKEIEYEVVRDKYDNCITVCNMENIDPMGIHTGESIVVAPSQTLSNEEFHLLREVAIKTIRHLGIVGECNIQYALSPNEKDYRVIEVNARLSRSSALASKATGYPLAFVAAKLALGYGLHELPNSVTRTTKAFFEPALDYIVVKVPRWDLKKFRLVKRKLGSSMKSVGEVMAIGRKFEEAIQKAMRMLDIGVEGLTASRTKVEFDELKEALENPTEERMFAIVQALKQGYSIEWIHSLTHINKWFLYKIQNIVELEKKLESSKYISHELLLEAKQHGFSDRQIANVFNKDAHDIYMLRKKYNIKPYIQHIDTLAAEYPAKTNYLYLSYNSSKHDFDFKLKNSIVIIGSGPYRIGSSVEFDWCCVNTSKTLRNCGIKSVMINCNPETVSTDYDESDALFFEELTTETIWEIYTAIKAKGVIVSMGGQTPNNLALKLHKVGIKILGTSPESIDKAEDRSKFSSMLDELEIGQPEWQSLTTLQDALQFANKVGYPVLVRPSYVLSGAAMAIATDDLELTKFLQKAVDVSSDHPVVISKFLVNAKELEFDAVAQNGKIICSAISEHVENAGVHSGDATLVLPAQRTYLETIRQIKEFSAQIAKSLNINGPFNIQYLAKDNNVKVIECNLRASRSFPFVSKTLKKNFIEVATKIIIGQKVQPINDITFNLDYVGVKAPEFSFTRLEGADPTTGVEMASTGEVACLGEDFNEAFLKALQSVGYKFPVKSILISSGTIESKSELLEPMKQLLKIGIKFYATQGTAKFMNANGIPTEMVDWPSQNSNSNAVELIKNKVVDLVINIPKNFQEEELTNDYLIRRAAVDFKIPLITNRQLAMRLAEALLTKDPLNLEIKSWNEY